MIKVTNTNQLKLTLEQWQTVTQFQGGIWKLGYGHIYLVKADNSDLIKRYCHNYSDFLIPLSLQLDDVSKSLRIKI